MNYLVIIIDITDLKKLNQKVLRQNSKNILILFMPLTINGKKNTYIKNLTDLKMYVLNILKS